jgi:hypothetical protein
MNATTLRQQFPEFADAAAYPAATVDFWLGVGVLRLNADRWSDLLDHGLALFTAHHLVLARRAALVAAKGGLPGTGGGVLASKTVGSVAASYDTGAAKIDGAGAWNQTTYGVQFWQLALMVGSGGVQL